MMAKLCWLLVLGLDLWCQPRASRSDNKKGLEGRLKEDRCRGPDCPCQNSKKNITLPRTAPKIIAVLYFSSPRCHLPHRRRNTSCRWAAHTLLAWKQVFMDLPHHHVHHDQQHDHHGHHDHHHDDHGRHDHHSKSHLIILAWWRAERGAQEQVNRPSVLL